MRLKNWFLLGAVLFGVCLTSQAVIYLDREGSINGIVIDQQTGSPVSGCRVELHQIFNFDPDAVYITQVQGATLSSSTIVENENVDVDADLFPPESSYVRASTRTTFDGRFSFTNLWTGSHPQDWPTFEIHVNDPKYQNEAVAGQFSAGSNDWGTIEVSERPFYFENSRINTETPNVVETTVVNTTGKKAYMRFWLTGRLERLDDSEYFGCSSEVPLKLKRRGRGYKNYATYRLVPGENKIKLRIKDYGPNIDVSRIMINGGRSSSKPMMVSTYVLRHMIITMPPVTWPPPVITNLPPIIIPGLTNIYPRPVIPTNPPIVIRPPYTTHSGVQASMGTATSQ